MRIRIHPETTDGKPIPGSGTIIAAETPSCLVELMRLQSPFSGELPVAEYRDEVLLHTEGPERRPLSDDPQAADIEFLTRLAERARIEFLPDDMLPEEPESAEDEEGAACAVSRTK
ncbi:MAG: hypothetical protein HOJ57_44770 [Lentisphaerae bacterium]|jgi:hypothetical protein|nr:hypothetical protein [Lentisphaerota bacterium]MBT5613132.1 hypothetical protein [Lentisphaerota bacterium]